MIILYLIVAFTKNARFAKLIVVKFNLIQLKKLFSQIFI